MYSYLIGEIKHVEGENVILEVNNIGYKLQMPLSEANELNINETHKIYTEFTLREDGVYLYGFISQDSHKLFLNLTSVSSIGPKNGLSILSTLSNYEVKKAIVTNDINILTKAPGIGRKTASRIILELSDKIELDFEQEEIVKVNNKASSSANYDFALEALINLGYQRAQAQKAIDKMNTESMDLSEIVRLALKNI